MFRTTCLWACVLALYCLDPLGSARPPCLYAFPPQSPMPPDATKALAKLLIQKANLPSPQPPTQKPPAPLKPSISCKDLIHSTLNAPSDGKVVSICENAKDRCVEYAALKYLVERGQSPFPEEQTLHFLAELKENSIKGRARCEAVRRACRDKDFLTSLFDSRESASYRRIER